jgi:hypothetical protein
MTRQGRLIRDCADKANELTSTYGLEQLDWSHYRNCIVVDDEIGCRALLVIDVKFE